MPLSGIRFSADDIKRFNTEHPNYDETHYIGLAFKKFELFNPAFFQIDRIYYNHNEIRFEGDSVDTSIIAAPENPNRPMPVPLIENGAYTNEELGFFQLREEHRGFTLFSADILNSICEYSNYVTVSGKAIQYGQMAYARNNLNGQTQQSSYFGLKIEGDMEKLYNILSLLNSASPATQQRLEELNDLVQSGNEARIQELIAVSEENPVIHIGNDCPPYWEVVLKVIIQLLKDNPISSKSINSNNLHKNYFPLITSAWMEFQERFIK